MQDRTKKQEQGGVVMSENGMTLPRKKDIPDGMVDVCHGISFFVWLIFFNDLYFQKVKIDGIYKIVLIKPCFIVFLKFPHGGIKPHRFG